MKHFRVITLAIMLLSSSLPLFAGPFISISSIDAEKNFPAIEITATIQNRHGSAISGLDEENILVYEDGYRVNYVKVMDMTRSTDYCYLVFAIDSSKSLSEGFFKSVKKYATDIITSTPARDRIALYRFNDTVSLLSNFSIKRNELTAKIESLKRHGTKTHLFDAIYDSLELLAATKDGIHRGAVFFTDGKDEGSSITENDIISLSRKLGIPLSFICPAKTSYQKRMKRLSKLTGGEVYTDDNKTRISLMYREMIQKLRTRYRILYRTISPADGKSHVLEVRLRDGSLKDRDTATFTLKKSLFFKSGISGYGILLFLLILLVLVILGALLFFTIKSRIRKNDKSESDGHMNGYKGSGTLPDGALYPVDEEFDYINAEENLEDETSYSSAWLVEKQGSSTGQRYEIIGLEFTIGFADDNSLSIDDEYISDYHSRIKRVRDSFYLFDLASENGTYLNDKKLLRPKLLYDWDEITIAEYRFIFRGTIKTGF